MVKTSLPREEYMLPGHFACAGCGAAISMRVALKALGKKAVFSIPACCWAVIPGPFPYRTLDVPLLYTAFAVTGASVSGLSEGFKAMGEDAIVVGWAGDGGTADIGLQSLSAAVERGHDFIYVMYDNEAYMNTGIQRSSATPEYAWTTTTPVGKREFWKKGWKKDMVGIMVAHRIPYAATASPAFPEDMFRKFKKALEIKGPRFIHILSPCPPGWRYPEEKTIEVARKAVMSKVFPLYEVEGGRWRVTFKPARSIPVEEYLKMQGRFRYLPREAIEYIQETVDREWERLLRKEELSKEGPIW